MSTWATCWETNVGITEFSLLALVCAVPAALVLGGGVVLGLIKLGVIGNYWFNREPPQTGQNYTLDQSADAADVDDR